MTKRGWQLLWEAGRRKPASNLSGFETLARQVELRQKNLADAFTETRHGSPELAVQVEQLNTQAAALLQSETDIKTLLQQLASPTGDNGKPATILKKLEKLYAGNEQANHEYKDLPAARIRLANQFTATEEFLKESSRKAQELASEMVDLLSFSANTQLSESFAEAEDAQAHTAKFWLRIGLFIVTLSSGYVFFLLYRFLLGTPVQESFSWMYFLPATSLAGIVIYCFAMYGSERRLESAYTHKRTVAKSVEAYRQMLLKMAEEAAEKPKSENIFQLSADFVVATARDLYAEPTRKASRAKVDPQKIVDTAIEQAFKKVG